MSKNTCLTFLLTETVKSLSKSGTAQGSKHPNIPSYTYDLPLEIAKDLIVFFSRKLKSFTLIPDECSMISSIICCGLSGNMYLSFGIVNSADISSVCTGVFNLIETLLETILVICLQFKLMIFALVWFTVFFPKALIRVINHSLRSVTYDCRNYLKLIWLLVIFSLESQSL